MTVSSHSATLRDNTSDAQHALLASACTTYTARASYSRSSLPLERYVCMPAVQVRMWVGLVLDVAMRMRVNLGMGMRM